MPLNPAIVKPFAAAWRARAYFIIGFIFWLLHSTITPPFASAPSKQWWQDLIDKAVGSFDKIAYAVLLAGLVYAVISDLLDYVWANNLQAEVQKGFRETGEVLKDSLASFTSGLVGMTFESVKVWIEGGRGDKQQLRAVAHSALVNHYGRHNDHQDSFLTFSLDGMLDNWAQHHSETWEDLSSQVIIRSCNVPKHFEWEDNRTYTLVRPSKSGDLPLQIEGSVQVQASDVITALERMDYRIWFGNNQVADFKTWWATNKLTSFDKTFSKSAGGIIVEYDGVWLRCEVTVNCTVTENKTRVRIHEKSLISTEDRCYMMALRNPTNGVRVSLTMEGLTGWIVKPAVASAQLYIKGKQAVQIDRNHTHSCYASVPGWSLPGLAVVVEWTPV
jgi:hypothetical protein